MSQNSFLRKNRTSHSQNTPYNYFIFQALADERESILNTLKRQESVTEQLSQEKQNLSLTKLELKAKLDNIEEKTQTLLQEKSEAEVRCVYQTSR